ncbi:MAG TPA: hypothetical protein VGF24_30225 [Vicinamibacterales bacterium]|jgi:hypothetical protein
MRKEDRIRQQQGQSSEQQQQKKEKPERHPDERVRDTASDKPKPPRQPGKLPLPD